MSDPDTFPSPALRALYRHPDVHAVVRLTPEGTLREHIGEAESLKPDELAAKIRRTDSQEPTESLYIRLIEDDFLIVVFSEDCDFEPLKQDIDQTILQVS